MPVRKNSKIVGEEGKSREHGKRKTNENGERAMTDIAF
jgi:hypothetical protein